MFLLKSSPTGGESSEPHVRLPSVRSAIKKKGPSEHSAFKARGLEFTSANGGNRNSTLEGTHNVSCTAGPGQKQRLQRCGTELPGGLGVSPRWVGEWL